MTYQDNVDAEESDDRDTVLLLAIITAGAIILIACFI